MTNSACANRTRVIIHNLALLHPIGGILLFSSIKTTVSLFRDSSCEIRK